MKLPRVRFTVRRLMVAVATTAILIGTGMEGGRLIRRARYCQRWAKLHALTETRFLGMAAEFRSRAARVQSPAFRQARLARFGLSSADPAAALVPMIDPQP